jgi:NADH:ubiquinone oxidoreductase subunit F (NADH-binding)
VTAIPTMSDDRSRSAAAVQPRLFSGLSPDAGQEPYAAHLARLGPLPSSTEAARFIPILEASGLGGRGGSGFPVGRKWRSVAERSSGGDAVVVANAAEGEPRSAKDRALLALRPHLAIDGAILAAEAVGASEAVLYVGTEHRPAVEAARRAIAERSAAAGRNRHREPPVTLVEAPVGYVSGEASAVVHYLNGGDAKPTSRPPLPAEHGVRDLPTLVQNVESLAWSALIARHGDGWYRSLGRSTSPGGALVTLSGPVASPGVREIEFGTTLRELVAVAGGLTADVQAVMLGGYFGGWSPTAGIWDLPIDPAVLESRSLGFGCGIVAFLPAEACGVWATGQVMGYMAGESARQCGPCVFGLGAIAGATRRLAALHSTERDLHDVVRWSEMVAGRGACHHPDGAAGLLRSSLAVFAEEFNLHQYARRCSRPASLARHT